MVTQRLNNSERAIWRKVSEEAIAIAVSDDFYQQERLLQVSLESGQFHYRKRDFLKKSGQWRDQAWKILSEDLHARGKNISLGHSDMAFGYRDWWWVRTRAYVAKIYATNLHIPFGVASKLGVFPLPLGLPNSTSESPAHLVAGNLDLIIQASLDGESFQGELRPYANFSPATFSREREGLLDLCNSTPWVKVGNMEVTTEGRLNYLREMKRYGLVVCPRGNGLDTHRFYEALALGVLPVVKAGDYGARLASKLGLPAVILQHWGHLAQKEKVYDAVRKALFDFRSMESLRFSYWVSKLEKN